MSRSIATISTPDGACEASVFRPDTGEGPWPAVLFFMDGLGIRPALFEIAERIAGHGYLVLLPDLFHRTGTLATIDAKALFGDPDARAAWFSAHISKVGAAPARVDTAACLDFLAAVPDVKQPSVGTVGYCMGGGLSLSAAGNFPDRVVAAASFHGGRLATDAPESPHLLAPKTKARVLVAGAIEDASFTDEMKARLEAALTAAGVRHTVETYPAKHGWVPSDTPVHDAAQAERHFEALFALFDAELKLRRSDITKWAPRVAVGRSSLRHPARVDCAR
jgi:carboxymethylenebutenolidase